MNLSTTPKSAAQLRQLSNEVNRIAATLDRLVLDQPQPGYDRVGFANDASTASVPIEEVRQAIQLRRLRSAFFDEQLFADPAWDMLLDLLHSELAQLRVATSSLCIAANVPATTSLRWINALTEAGLFKRRPDPCDGRRVFVELTPEASQKMRGYFNAAGRLPAS
jgi:DNA-binding MarR family transcriptional regulator